MSQTRMMLHCAKAKARRSGSHGGSRGFTLLELMITISVMAILVAVAVPAYSDYVRRGKIAEATSYLADMRVKMEQYFQDNRQYTGACAANTIAPVPTGKYFVYDCPTLTATAYTVRAVGIASQGMGNFEYWIDQSNNKTTVRLPANWNQTGLPKSCWVLKKDGSC